MDVKEAVRLAKQHIAELFKDEDAKDIGLEEIEFDGPAGAWRVTVGFSRPWNDRDEPQPLFPSLNAIPTHRRVRDMKVVILDDVNGNILSVRNRE